MKQLDDHDDDAKYEQLICGLLHHEGNVEKAAAASGISRATAYRWLKRPRFASMYREARKVALGSAMAGLELGSAAAVSALKKGFTDADASQVSVTSARWFLTLALKVHELETVHEELEVLRANLNEMREQVYSKKTPAAEAAAPLERVTPMLDDDQTEAVSLRSLWMNLVGHDQTDIAASLKFNRPQSVAEEQELLEVVRRLVAADNAGAESESHYRTEE